MSGAPKEVNITLGLINSEKFNNPNDIADYGVSFQPCRGAEDGTPICVSQVQNNISIGNGEQRPELGWVLK